MPEIPNPDIILNISFYVILFKQKETRLLKTTIFADDRTLLSSTDFNRMNLTQS